MVWNLKRMPLMGDKSNHRLLTQIASLQLRVPAQPRDDASVLRGWTRSVPPSQPVALARDSAASARSPFREYLKAPGGTPLRHEGRAVRPWMDAWLPALSLAYATGCDFRTSLTRRPNSPNTLNSRRRVRPPLPWATLFSAGFCLAILLLSSSLAIADSPEELQFFESKIRPIFVEHCYGCHSEGGDKLRGNLLLDSKEGWKQGGDSGEPAILPGNSSESLLMRAVRHEEAGMEMPPDKPRLSDREIADLATWIDRGALDPRDGAPLQRNRADSDWWSLQPVQTQFSYDSIDGFLDHKLREAGLQRNPPADPRSLIRRLYYDLHGLPPAMEDVREFSKQYNSASDRASQRQVIAELVDRLLASPRYGEQWGRHWLDVVRFGESNGFERNVLIDNLYPFRDYVIRSINEDKPFHQWIIEHLAGDVIGKDNPEVEIGSAFLVAGPYDDVGNQDAVAAANIRAATLDEMITTTGSAFLGMTIHCARCHHHKFDPIPTEDYYRIRAALEGVSHGTQIVATKQAREEHAARVQPLHQELGRLQGERAGIIKMLDERAAQERSEEPAATRPKVDSYGTEERFDAAEAKFVRFLIHSITTDDPAGGRRGGAGGKLTEFQAWTAGEEPKNVALTKNGTVATGAKSAFAEDFPEAYGPHYCIDGDLGEAWFIGSPAILTLEFPHIERIDRIRFINARGDKESTDDSAVRGGTPCEYEVQVSLDGEIWRTVATEAGREPWSESHRVGKRRRETITEEEKARLEGIDRLIREVHGKLAAVPPIPHWFVGLRNQPAQPTTVHQGGDPAKPLHAVAPSSLQFLDRSMSGYSLPEDAPEGLRRLALAQWIARDDNPLTRRVIVNRIWHYHFGTGLVDSPSDFGYLGSLPSHPELLDFLAERFRQVGWRWKPLHREILLSEAYLQSSEHRADGGSIDKSSRLLWRFPPRRLTAEELRDSMLAVTGKLSLEPMGGPGFRLYRYTQNNVSTYFPLDRVGPETYRRAVYHQTARASVVDLLTDFDLPDIAFAAPARSSTISPMQALTMLNHSFIEEMAQAMAERVQSTDSNGEGESIEEQVNRAFGFYLQRTPTEIELNASRALIAEHGLAVFCRAMWNLNEFIYLD